MNSILAGIELIQKGGFVMYPLLIAALIALTIIFERVYVFLKVYKTSPAFITQTLKQIRDNQFSQAIENCKKSNTPVASVLISGVEHFENPIEEMELCMKNQAESWVPLLEKRVEVLDTIITAAPLLGLLGTITGMMGSFEVLSEKGVNEPHAITGGVAEALIATATGLIIALFCLLAYNYLTTKIKLFIYEVESVASKLVEIRLSTHRNRSKS
jgi:biopolymer transport protein ExbB